MTETLLPSRSFSGGFDLSAGGSASDIETGFSGIQT